VSTALKINGQVREFSGQLPATLAALLQTLHIDEATVVAELDGKIVPRTEFGSTALYEWASIELVRFVGGG
jgi:thiamine biosynthesis protein ThiS